jgi:tRNA-specific 2-thiouridylase
VAVALSGGVDSSVAALLLKERGLGVAGVTMHLGAASTAEKGASEGIPREVGDARRVCAALDIPHHLVDFAAHLEEKVIGPFVEAYRRGRTPNPCVLCNRRIKFGALLEWALAQGFDALATGHYAAIRQDGQGYRLAVPLDRRKDQTYFLYALRREALARLLFPLADRTKEEVRQIARRAALPVFDKPESQDICFIPIEGCAAFLEARGAVGGPGEIVDREGRILGRHRGIACYTIGQRGGLGVSAPAPLYVLRIDAARNRLIVGGKGELSSQGLTAGEVNRLVDAFPEEAWGKIRYAHKPARCRLSPQGDRLSIRFAEPQEAIAPGQSVVLYGEDVVLGGGIIEEVL